MKVNIVPISHNQFLKVGAATWSRGPGGCLCDDSSPSLPRWPHSITLYALFYKVGMQFAQPATWCSLGPWKPKNIQLPGPTTHEHSKNLIFGLP
ncbi:MAG: hypothetical protein AB7E77_03725, partial [Desulfobulbus sp.]